MTTGKFEQYTVMVDSRRNGFCDEKINITKEGALIIWGAYEKLYGQCQTMDTREGRGGICYSSEIDHWKSQDALPEDFNWKDYIVKS